MAEATLQVSDLLDGHVVLDVECLDRIYLNGYVPRLQVGGQVAGFMTRHLGYPIPSPAVMEKIGTAFRRSVTAFADIDHIPVVRFAKADRKIDVMRRYVVAQARTGRSGVAAIGIAQEFQTVFLATLRDRNSGVPWYSFTKADRRVTCYYFYLWDDEFGPGFLKFSTPARCCAQTPHKGTACSKSTTTCWPASSKLSRVCWRWAVSGATSASSSTLGVPRTHAEKTAEGHGSPWAVRDSARLRQLMALCLGRVRAARITVPNRSGQPAATTMPLITQATVSAGSSTL